MQGQSNFRIALLCGVSALAVVTSMSASARAADLIRSGIETVTVTAERKKENLQSVPIAISAFSQKQLTDRQIAGGPDLVKEVPNLTFSKTNFTGYNLEIRGIGTQAISVTTDPAVSVALNGIPFIRNHFFEEKFFDLSNVEVLRGPQGTLWGRNSNAGVVNIVTAKPVGHFEAEGSVAVGNYNSRRFEGMVNLPIVGSKFDIRMAGEWTKRDGYAFNQTTNQPIDGRDLWSGRFSARFRPNSNFEADFVWEHFQENDDRLRSGKQLCMTDPGPTSFVSANGTVVPVPSPQGGAFGLNSSWFSQGCLPNSLYNKNSFEVPNGFSLPFVQGATFMGFINTNLNPYAQTTQSTNLRDIQSAINPTYIAKNDTLEFNAQWHAKPWLTVYSDTGYNHDFLWSSEDYNRFDTTPGIFIPDTGYASRHMIDPVTKMFCDPQLGCSDRLVVQDLATEKSWQFSQEFRAMSDLSGPLNFSVGANYLHYETTEDYYVFSNTFTMMSLNNVNCNTIYQPGVTNDLYCLPNGPSYTNPATNNSIPTESPQYVDPNPIHSLNNEGHNYFLSQNPYTLNSYAAFGEAYYQVRPDLKLTAGLRWTRDEKHFDEIPSELLAKGYGYPSTGVVNQEWGRLTGRFVANWTPKLSFTDQTMIYASYAHGYKAGGANPPGPVLLNADTGATTSGVKVNVTFPVHPLTFKPEYIDAFELGTKNEALGDNLVFNADVFYYNYKNYQISQIVDRTSVNLNFNAQVKGAEVQTQWTPLQGLSFSFNGGYEDATLDSNQYAIDLMDRTAGHPGWVVMKPSAGQSSNCIFPEYVAAALVQAFAGGGEGDPGNNACGSAYTGGIDPVTLLPYVANPTTSGTYGAVPPGYPGFNPATAPNNGEGFAKNVGGKQLPNAPHFTASLTADYSMPLSQNWVGTFHTDFYWQSQSWARVFNDPNYDKIHGYSNLNLALIFNDATGTQIMAYVKNVFDTTAITGDFLNSDDTGLTTNIFLTSPRLYGIRITKKFGEGGWNDGGGLDFIPSFFTDADGKAPHVWLTLGGDYNEFVSASERPYNPLATANFPNGGNPTPTWAKGLPTPAQLQHTPTSGFDWNGALSFRPPESDWVFKAAVRYGRSSRNVGFHKSQAVTPSRTMLLGRTCGALPTKAGSYNLQSICKHGFFKEFDNSKNASSEQHAILDFTVGKEVGIGLFGTHQEGTLAGGVRIAQFDSRSHLNLGADPVYHLDPNIFKKYHEIYEFTSNESRSFRGMGPEVTWNAHTPLVGNVDDGEVTLDWGMNFAVLFGRQRINLQHTVIHCRHSSFGTLSRCDGVAFGQAATGEITEPADNVVRSHKVGVPNLGGHIGASMVYKNARISVGYRYDGFFGVMDGGERTPMDYNRSFAGPYVNFTLGLGG